MTTVLFTKATKKQVEVKTIDYILAMPAAVAVGSFINVLKNDNAFLNFGRWEFSAAATVITLRATAEVVASYRTFIAEAINEIKGV